MKIEFDEEQEELDFVQYHEKLGAILQTVKPEVYHTYSCKYYLPCGKCDKTGEMCSLYYSSPVTVNPNVVPDPNGMGWVMKGETEDVKYSNATNYTKDADYTNHI